MRAALGAVAIVAVATAAGCSSADRGPRSRVPAVTTVPGQRVDAARPFSATSPWNTPTPPSTRWFDAPALRRLPGGSARHWWVNTKSVGIVWTSARDPLWTFVLPDYVAPEWHRNRPASTFRFRAPSDLQAGTDSDRILVVIDAVTGNYVELWESEVDARTRTVTNRPGQPGWARGNAITGPGAGTISNNDGVRASNFSWAAGLITGADLARRRIDHALVVSLTIDTLRGGSPPVGPYRAPATSGNGAWPRGTIVMGSRIGIPRGVPRPRDLSPTGVMVFDALQQYGAFVGDFAGGPAPVFYADGNSVPGDAMDAHGVFDDLVGYWDHGGSADMEKIAPLLRVADYQP